MAKVKIVMTLIREISNADMETDTDEECLKAIKEEISHDYSFALDTAMELEADKIEVTLAV